MITKYTEALLSVRYRIKTEKGLSGGPMYMIILGLPKKLHPLAWFYGFFGMIASFGVGNAAQINAAMTGLRTCFESYGRVMSPTGQLLVTVLFALLIGAMLMGGAKSVASAAERLVPVASAGYMLLCFGVLLICWRQIPGAFACIIQGRTNHTPGNCPGRKGTLNNTDKRTGNLPPANQQHTKTQQNVSGRGNGNQPFRR